MLGDDAHRRDARAAGHEQQIARLAAHHERGPKRAEQIEALADMTLGDPLAARAERLHDELELALPAIDAAERVRTPQQGIPAATRSHVHELTGVRTLGDLGGAHGEERPELAELRARDDAAFFEDHSGTPTANV